MPGQRIAALLTLTVLISGFSIRSLLSADLQEQKRTVLLKAVRIAVAIEPPPALEISSLARHLRYLNGDQIPLSEALFETPRRWATQTESLDEYWNASEAANEILYWLYPKYPYTARRAFAFSSA